MKPIDLAYFIVNNYSSYAKDITPLKLQKLLYYNYIWSFIDKNKLADLKFERWTYGPVDSQVYDYFKKYGKDKINPDLSKATYISSKDQKLINFITLNYIKFSPITLSTMTHNELPWQKTEDNQVIGDELILQYYSKFNFAKNFPLNKNKKFYPVDSDLNFSFKLDMTKDVAKKVGIFDSFNEYLTLNKINEQEFETEFKKFEFQK